METYILKVVLKEAGRPLRVQLYYATVRIGEDPLALFEEQDMTPDLASPFVIAKLTPAEALGFKFVPGDLRNVVDA